MLRYVVILSSLTVLASTAVAVPPPHVFHNCPSQEDYVARGGKFSQTKLPDFSAIDASAPNLFAGRGETEIDFAGYIETDGESSIIDVDTAMTCYHPKKPGDPTSSSSRINAFGLDETCLNREFALRKVLSKVRYEPPVVDGNSVCVHVQWKVKYSPDAKLVEP
jgi:hypothetical protein